MDHVSMCRRRADWAFALLGVVGLALAARLYSCQISRHAEARETAARQCTEKEVLPAQTGALLDRCGRAIAISVPVESVCAEIPFVEDPDSTAHLLAPVLGLEVEPLRIDLTGRAPDDRGGVPGRSRKFVWIKRRVTAEEAHAVRLLRLPGISFRDEFRRVYPNGSLAAHFLQGRGQDEQSSGGLERACDRWLRGTDGMRLVERDALGRTIVRELDPRVKPLPGSDVTLTLDLVIQQIVEEELDAACAEFKPSCAMAIVIDPHTGEILAGAVRPTFDPNTGNGPAEARRNRLVTDPYEPGSTMKPFIASWIFQNGLGSPATRINCMNGVFRYRGRTLHDHHPYGMLSIEEVISKSSNIGAAQLGLRLEAARLQDCLAAFGFGAPTGSGLPGEGRGKVTSPARWSYYTTTSVPMGHEINATVLQLARAYCVFANGGDLIWPHLVARVTDPEGRTTARTTPTVLRRVLRPETVRQMVAIMSKVVSEGTGTKARLTDLALAGKTGTAQKIDANGQYRHDAHVSSFIAFAPVEDPRALALVLLDSPQGEYYGGTVAAPACSRILDRTVNYLAIPPGMNRMSEATHGAPRDAHPVRAEVTRSGPPRSPRAGSGPR
ncbi:MAG: penicillin-binding protein 2 [Planctomycetes bacterium]|nr:penicillin-binding protein 2 [Planctomycetota bacterium]